MKRDSTVVISLHTPREKFWGQMLELNSAGVTIRGLDLSTFDEWLNQLGGESPIGLATIFFPLYRIEKVELDEPVGEIPSLSAMFQQKTGRTFREYVKGRQRTGPNLDSKPVNLKKSRRIES